MYARVATFEGDAASFDASLEEMRRDASSGPPEGVPATGFLMLLDRDAGEGLAIALFDSEEDMRKGDEALNAMSPPSDSPMRRVSVKKYEVPVKFGL
jgi:hypothetical protein